MIAESMTTQVLHVISLALTPSGQWCAAIHPFGAFSAAGGWLTVFAMVALITSVILMFWRSADHRRSEDHLKRKIFEITAADEKLLDNYRQSKARLKREVAGLTFANEKHSLIIGAVTLAGILLVSAPNFVNKKVEGST